MRKKGFTLIELIVVMAIIAILVLLGVPKYKEYAKEAHLTKIKVNVKELETASSQYYIRNNDWPRLSDEPYNAEQVENFGKQIHDKTGAVVTLESDGKYYDIDFVKIKNYIKLPDDNINYILQNPVGKVFFIEGITKEAKERIPDGDDSNVEPETPEDPNESEIPIEFSGLSPAAFDKDSSTSGGLGTVTWVGDLANKKVTIDIKGGQYNDQKITFKIYDSNNIAMNFINLTNSIEVDSIITGSTRIQKEILVPECAVKFVLSGYGGAFEIYASENLESPKSVYNITSTSTDSSITLNWEQADLNYAKAAIYKDGKLLAITTEKTYTDKPLYSSSSNTYEIQAINSYGNASSEKVSYTASTTTPEIIFRGLTAGAFDKDIVTYGGSGTVTWEGNLSNKKIVLVLKGGQYNDQPLKFSIYDINNNVMNFMNLTNNIAVNVISVGKDKLQKEIIVPDGAVKFVLSGYGGAYDIYVSDSL